MVNDGSLQDDPDGDKGADGVKAKSDIYTRAERRTRLLEWTFPAASAYHEVHDILTKLHGEVTQPEVMPGPSLQVAGCGEVPSVLDALLRTLLSGATSMENANRAVQGLAARFPLAMSGSGQGSIDWDTVRRSSIAKLTTAIRSGGLSNIKAKYIKQILDKVYADNIGKKEPLSLDFMHQMSGKEALLELAKLPGVGVKTAACVVLFCLKKPMFAVDTHVHRLCRWLGWVPPKSTADDTFFHLNTRIPQELHYGLHQLFIRHGKVCGRCSARSTEGGPIWEQVVCPLEHLLVRFDKRKTQITAKTAKGVEESDDEYRLAPEKSKASNSNAKEILAPKAGKKSTQPGATDTLATEATKKRGHSNAKDNSSRARKTSNDANAEDGPKPSKKSTTRVGRTKHAVSGGKAANDTNTVTGGQVTAVGVAEAPPTNAAVSGLGRRPWTRSMAKQLMDG